MGLYILLLVTRFRSRRAPCRHKQLSLKIKPRILENNAEMLPQWIDLANLASLNDGEQYPVSSQSLHRCIYYNICQYYVDLVLAAAALYEASNVSKNQISHRWEIQVQRY
jgi:hypothetical protein